MNKQPEQIEAPHELEVMRAINRGEQNLYSVDWKTYLSELVAIVDMLPDQTYIGVLWLLLGEIDDGMKRTSILGRLQEEAPKCFPSKEAADAFISDADCLVRINSRIRQLGIQRCAKIPDTYTSTEPGRNGYNELALLWSDKYVSACDLVALASEVRNSVQVGAERERRLVEFFLYSSRNYEKLPFDNMYDFFMCLFLAESFRHHLITGKMNSAIKLCFVDFKRTLRNECFDEYIRLRIKKIKEELDDDNTLLLDPTEWDCYARLYEEESAVYNRQIHFEEFRGSAAYAMQWCEGRPDVLEMMRYFMAYLELKMKEVCRSNQQPQSVIYHVQGDLVQGNKHVDTQINHVSPNSIGAQINQNQE